MSLSILMHSSPNFSRNKASNKLVVIHATASNNGAGALSWLSNPKSGVSAHYLVDTDGKIYNLISEELVAWHCGVSEWKVDGNLLTDLNRYSIGIEVTGDNKTPFSEVQKASLVELTKDILNRHKLTADRVVRHLDVAVPKGRKSDPFAVSMDWNWFKSQLQTPMEVPAIPPLSMEEEVQAKFIAAGFMSHNKDLKGPAMWGEVLLVLNRLYDSLRLK